jgi:hypothetical protein
MADLTVAQEELLAARQKANHYTLPPFAMAGIGQPVTTLAPAVFGGLRLKTPTTFTLDIVPKQITFFDVLYPEVGVVGLNPEGLLPSVVASEVIIAQQGVYVVDIAMTVSINGAEEYALKVLLNGSPTGALIAVDTARNADEVNIVTALVLHNLQVGDAITISGEATANAVQFDPISAGMYLTRLR